MANAIAAEPILQGTAPARTNALAHSAGLQIVAPLATIRGPDVVDGLFSIPLLRREHSL